MKVIGRRIILFTDKVENLANFYSTNLGFKIKEISQDKKWIDISTGGFFIGIHFKKISNASKRQTKLVFYCADVNGAREELLKKGVKMGKLHISKEIVFSDGLDLAGNSFQISNRM